MEQNNITATIQTIFRQFFKTENIVLTEHSSANDIDAWDSLNHMSLMGEIEREFNIEFEFFELMDFQNIGDLVAGITSKIKK